MDSILVRSDFRSVCYRAEILKWYQRRILRKTFGIWTEKVPFRIPVLDDSSALDKIDYFMTGDKPAMMCRWGSTELDVVYESLKIANGLKKTMGKKFMSKASFESGFFPETQDVYMRFSQRILSDFKGADILGVWGNKRTYPIEEYVMKAYNCSVVPVPFEYVSPLGKSRPWSRFLKDKKVVVIHPFVGSIQRQYEKRHLLFRNPETLPDFDLILIKAVLSNVSEQVDYTDWFAALKSMENQLAQIDFDYLIVGAGAYGLCLAAYAKSLGKKAIHLGGATQLLFGIRGNRWDERHGFYDQIGANLEYWVRPNDAERPKMHYKLENSNYW